MQHAPGDLIGGKYRVVRVLGEGGMGIVYEASHDKLGTNVAIKVLRDEVMKDKESVARFAREARAAAVLRSSNAARILDVGEVDDGRPFMVMELLDGNDLDVELQRRGPLPTLEATGYVAQACDAIAEAHRLGIIHRDLKPANLFLVTVAGIRVVKVLDFGISRFDGAGESRVTQTQSAFGTPLYMSPEALRSAKHTDARSDVWAFGVILYELLTGQPPFIADSPTGVAVAVTLETPKPITDFREDVPLRLLEIIEKAMQKDPSRRFQNASELRDVLQAFLGTDRPSQLGVAPMSARNAPMPTAEVALKPLAAPAVSQRLRSTTQTGEPLSGSVRAEPKSRVALIAGVAIATFAGAVSAFVLWRSSQGPGNASATTAVAASDTASPTKTADAIVAPAPSAVVSSETTSASASGSVTQAVDSASASTNTNASAPPVASVSSAKLRPTAGRNTAATTIESPPPATAPKPPPPPAGKLPGGNPSRL
ncbi:MAG: serine/threonine protein kinase [Polyangiaceae bacterium]|nr:serine/threonine protein kinase [Polyangiaceae bacterium]